MDGLSEASHHGRIPMTLGWRLVVYATCALAAWLGVAAVVVLIVAGAGGGRAAHVHASAHRRRGTYLYMPQPGHPSSGVQSG